MTPEQVAHEAMHRLSADLVWFDCRTPVLPAFAADFPPELFPCGECWHCLERAPKLREYHRLAALYPDRVPSAAPQEIKDAVKTARWKDR